MFVSKSICYKIFTNFPKKILMVGGKTEKSRDLFWFFTKKNGGGPEKNPRLKTTMGLQQLIAMMTVA